MMAQVFNEFFVAKFVELLYGKSELVRTQFLKEGTQIFFFAHCRSFALCDALLIHRFFVDQLTEHPSIKSELAGV